MSNQKAKVPVGRKALIRRINRFLEPQGRVLKISRGLSARSQLGEFFIIDTRADRVLQKNIDLEERGRALKLLEPFEVLELDP